MLGKRINVLIPQIHEFNENIIASSARPDSLSTQCRHLVVISEKCRRVSSERWIKYQTLKIQTKTGSKRSGSRCLTDWRVAANTTMRHRCITCCNAHSKKSLKSNIKFIFRTIFTTRLLWIYIDDEYYSKTPSNGLHVRQDTCDTCTRVKGLHAGNDWLSFVNISKHLWLNSESY